MKIMICLGGETFSRDTVRYGARIAQAFRSDVSVLYVEHAVSYFAQHEVTLSRQKLSEWSIEIPAVRLLRLAREIMRELGMLRTLPSGEIEVRHEMKPGIQGAYEWHVYGQHGENVRFRVRTGDIVDNIREEVGIGGYDLVILGASRKRRLVHKILQFVDTSILIVKNAQETTYRFLLCTDGSESARKAEHFVARAARQLKAHVNVLSVHQDAGEQHHAMEAAEHAARLLGRSNIPHDIMVREGEVEEVILREARADQVIVVGVSQMSEWKKFLLGSMPIRISQKGNSPVLLVK